LNIYLVGKFDGMEQGYGIKEKMKPGRVLPES
jgi:hypothetical protein